jgi:tellurite resistance protein TerB
MYKTDEIINAFNKISSKFEFDLEIGKSEVLNLISKIKTQNEAKLVVRACVLIANSDGDFDDREKDVVKKICKELNLNYADFI